MEAKSITAVEWLYEKLWKQTDFSLPNNILEQAKEMEKEQIIDSFNAGYINSLKRKYTTTEQYYNETFNQ